MEPWISGPCWSSAALVLLLAGCSPGDGDTPQAAGPGPEHAAAQNAGVVSPPASGDVLPWQLIGTHLDDPAVARLAEGLQGQPEREVAEGYGIFVSFVGDGIELSADTEGRIMTVILYSQLSKTYSEYQGPLPHGLSWQMARSDVEKLLGQPHEQSFTRNSTTKSWELFAEYPRLGLYVTYVTDSESDQGARLLDVRVKKPKL